MNREIIYEESKSLLKEISVNIAERPTGSKNNRRLENFAYSYFESSGYDIEIQQFKCIDWENNGAKLFFNGRDFNIKPSYYSNACNIKADYITLKTVAELEKSNLKGQIAVLHKELSRELLMPGGFNSYSLNRNQKIIEFLEEKEPLAIIITTVDDSYLLGSGVFDIPCAYISDEIGQFLMNSQGKIRLKINATKKDSRGANLIAQINPGKNKKLVITANLDTKYGQSGVLDNGTGIVILLLLSKMIKPEDIDFSMELLLLNGRYSYSNSGQKKYLEEYIIGNNETLLAINCDRVGAKNSKTAISFLELMKDRESLLKKIISKRDSIDFVEPEKTGDHMLFVMNKIPAVAITSKTVLNSNDNLYKKYSIEDIDYEELRRVIELLEEIIKTIRI